MYTEKEHLVLYDFISEHCLPCKMMKPTMVALKKRMKGKIDIVKISADESPDYAKALNLKSFPSFVLVKENNIIWRHSGMLSLKDFIEALNEFVTLKTK
ncbi:thioredoxin family protein [uncultured Aquimarina sp.]|uniref:thioredoxin family protein n=1 Tax=uncultured Aquimarina sp. TaxID=575652 RepID=UPI00260CCD18|nr:thioredoxin family protein [uncultured Aquimarina sp.]